MEEFFSRSKKERRRKNKKERMQEKPEKKVVEVCLNNGNCLCQELCYIGDECILRHKLLKMDKNISVLYRIRNMKTSLRAKFIISLLEKAQPPKVTDAMKAKYYKRKWKKQKRRRY